MEESCPHGMHLAAYNICRFCIDEKLAEILSIVQAIIVDQQGMHYEPLKKNPRDIYE